MHKLVGLHDTAVGSVRPRRDTQRPCSTLSHILDASISVGAAQFAWQAQRSALVNALLGASLISMSFVTIVGCTT
jgi:hypothetical protein